MYNTALVYKAHSKPEIFILHKKVSTVVDVCAHTPFECRNILNFRPLGPNIDKHVFPPYKIATRGLEEERNDYQRQNLITPTNAIS